MTRPFRLTKRMRRSAEAVERETQRREHRHRVRLARAYNRPGRITRRVLRALAKS